MIRRHALFLLGSLAFAGCAEELHSEDSTTQEAPLEVAQVAQTAELVVEEPVRLVDLDPALEMGATGLQVRPSVDGVLILDLIEGLPADRAQIPLNATIISVDGLPAAEMGFYTVVEMVRGPAGTTVELGLRLEDGSEETYVLTREALSVPQTARERVADLRRDREFGAIGARLDRDAAPGTIASLVEGLPAAEAGIVAGERIVAVDGQLTEDAETWQIVDAIRGEGGETVKLTVEGLDGEVRELTLVRETLTLPPSSARHCRVAD